MTTNGQLGSYLNDHLGGAHAGVEMARQLQDEIQGEADAEVLGRLAEEIEEDLDTLRDLVDTIGSTRHPIKQAAGWVAEKAHRLGVTETRTGSPHLTRLLQAETLSLGVEGKLCLWLALIEVAPSDPQLAAIDLQRLVDRALDQRRRLEVVRLAAARRAFATAD
jgi:hypothetical protein